MRKLLVIIFSFASSIVFAQKQVEKLETDEDVLKFVKDYFKDDNEHNWKDFHFANGTEWKNVYNLSKTVSDSIQANMHFSKWFTEDVNQDGKLDLIVTGDISDPNAPESNFTLLVFVSQKNRSYNVYNMEHSEEANFPLYANAILIGKKSIPGLRIVNWSPNINRPSNAEYPYFVDSVAFSNNYFLNYNTHPDALRIKSITYTQAGSIGNLSKLVLLNMDENRQATWRWTSYNGKDSSTLKGRVTVDVYSKLLALINYTNFSQLPSQLLSQNNDASANTIYFTVEYSNGTIKRLTDRSGFTSYSLSAVYGWCDGLVEDIQQQLQARQNNYNQMSSWGMDDGWGF
ncbi:hypothetical protein [Rhizosphaericola mali]|uniref:VCBS repeat-containing protein n=1 Tax=Rhizosphaericola mali TaxID=2545455 RepID=A0A5P2FWS6_9BACT|nr:hypothetical protein [Rhizosphaericola mali]QES87974.1 hypothetical protein E0W69_004600 [Rhizosphaericola mali]